jgi:hypothetical protein
MEKMSIRPVEKSRRAIPNEHFYSIEPFALKISKQKAVSD